MLINLSIFLYWYSEVEKKLKHLKSVFCISSKYNWWYFILKVTRDVWAWWFPSIKLMFLLCYFSLPCQLCIPPTLTKWLSINHVNYWQIVYILFTYFGCRLNQTGITGTSAQCQEMEIPCRGEGAYKLHLISDSFFTMSSMQRSFRTMSSVRPCIYYRLFPCDVCPCSLVTHRTNNEP